MRLKACGSQSRRWREKPMDSGTLALWLVGVLWALFAAWVWVSQRFMENAHKLHHALKERQDLQGHNMLTQATMDRELRTMRQTTDASVKLTGSVLAERIDAISARLDEVELACGLREKPKTMGGAR